MLMIALVLLIMLALAAIFAMRLMRSPVAAPDVAPMKVALERRMREGAEFRL